MANSIIAPLPPVAGKADQLLPEFVDLNNAVLPEYKTVDVFGSCFQGVTQAPPCVIPLVAPDQLFPPFEVT